MTKLYCKGFIKNDARKNSEAYSTNPMTSTTKRSSVFQPLRFVLSSGLATTSHWSVMAMMIIAGVAPTVATAVGALIGAIANYFLQRKVTFRNNSPHHTTLPRYIVACTVIWLLNLIFFFIFYQIALLSTVVAQGTTTLAVALISYFLYKRVVFNEHKTQYI